MSQELIVALICGLTFSSAARAFHGEPIKKQAVFPSYNVPSFYQDSQFYSTPYPPSQVGYSTPYPQIQGGVVSHGQIPQAVSSSAGTTGTTVKQSIVPQKSAAYPLPNSVSTQYPYPFKQYYP